MDLLRFQFHWFSCFLWNIHQKSITISKNESKQGGGPGPNGQPRASPGPRPRRPLPGPGPPPCFWLFFDFYLIFWLFFDFYLIFSSFSINNWFLFDFLFDFFKIAWFFIWFFIWFFNDFSVCCYSIITAWAPGLKNSQNNATKKNNQSNL